MLRFEIIEYKRDDTGNEVVASTYEIPSCDFYRTLEQLDDAVKKGVISSYAYSPV